MTSSECCCRFLPPCCRRPAVGLSHLGDPANDVAACIGEAECALFASNSHAARRRDRGDCGNADRRGRHRGFCRRCRPENAPHRFRRDTVHRCRRPRRRRQLDSGPAAAPPAGARGRRRACCRAGRTPRCFGTSALDRTRPAPDCRPLVRESRQLHGRARPDDGRRSRAGDGCRGPARLARRNSGIDDHRRRRAVRRAARIFAVQPACRKDLSGRRRQPADRPPARLVPVAARFSSAIRRRVSAPAILSGGCHGHAVPAPDRREPFWAAHRSHFYQRATDNGFTVWRIVSEVFALNMLLALLAIASTRVPSAAMTISLILIGASAVGLLMGRFSRRGLASG